MNIVHFVNKALLKKNWVLSKGSVVKKLHYANTTIPGKVSSQASTVRRDLSPTWSLAQNNYAQQNKVTSQIHATSTIYDWFHAH